MNQESNQKAAYMTLRQAAEYTGLSIKWFRRRVKNGDLTRFGYRKILILKAELDALLAKSGKLSRKDA